MSLDPSRMPSRKRYLLALGIVISGFGLFAAILGFGLTKFQKSLTRFVVPGEATLRLSQAGSYAVFYEHESRIDNVVFSTAPRIQGVTCDLDLVKSGNRIPPERPSADFSYNWRDEFSGYKVLTFKVSTPGDYHIACQYGRGGQEEKVVFAIGRDTFGVAAVLASLVSFFGGIVVSVWFGVRTYSARKAIKYLRQMQLANPQAMSSQTSPPTSQLPFSD